MIKRILLFLVGIMLLMSACPIAEEEINLLVNPSFEELDAAPVEALVTAISPLGSVSGDETVYTLRLSFAVPDGVWPGMHATIEK